MMYQESSELYDKMYHFVDYAVAAEELLGVIRTARPDSRRCWKWPADRDDISNT